ncbi:MAG: YoaK family protein [Jatrophihabitantaceae bacterium]
MRHRVGVGTLLMLLTVAAGSTDAVSYLGLDHVFPANMTGNTVLLGIGLTTGDWHRAAGSAVALGGFVVAAAVSGALAGRRSLGVDLSCELVLLAAALAWWLTLDAPVQGGPRLGLIALVSAAMGWQSATITRLDVGVSTTYITGTWTAVATWFAQGLRRHPSKQPDGRPYRRIAVLACYLGAACLAGYLFHRWGAWAAVTPLAALIISSVAPPAGQPDRPDS